jgi:hypothetical protein
MKIQRKRAAVKPAAKIEGSRMRQEVLISALSLSLRAFTLGVASGDPPQYQLIALGTFPGAGEVTPYGINDAGQVTGHASGPNVVFLSSNPSMIDITPNNGPSSGLGLNSTASVTGYAHINGGNHAFLYSNDVLTS